MAYGRVGGTVAKECGRSDGYWLGGLPREVGIHLLGQ